MGYGMFHGQAAIYLKKCSLLLRSSVMVAVGTVFFRRAPGIPRFNDMRRAMNMNPIKKWSDLTQDTEYQVCLPANDCFACVRAFV